MYKLGNKCTNYFTKCFLKYIHNIQEILNVRHFRLKFWNTFFSSVLFLQKVLIQHLKTHTHTKGIFPYWQRRKINYFHSSLKCFNIFNGKF